MGKLELKALDTFGFVDPIRRDKKEEPKIKNVYDVVPYYDGSPKIKQGDITLNKNFYPEEEVNDEVKK